MTVADQIIQVIEELCAKFGIAVDYTAEQIMPVFQDLIGRYANYIILSKTAFLILDVLLEGGLIFAVYRMYRAYHNENSRFYLEDGLGLVLILFSIMAVVGLVLSFTFVPMLVQQIIQAFTIPEMAFLNGIKNMLY